MMKRGFAIMLVLMMLFLLFMLGVAFFFSAWTHAFMARNYLNMKRAFVVAEGGVHHAIGNIIGDFAWVAHAQNKPANFRWKYWGDVEPGTPEPNLVEITKTPVEYAEYPSYAMPKTIEVFGEKVGLSGVMDPGGGAYGINSDIFHLKVTECSAQLYVNEGLGHPYNTAVMRRILNNLGSVIIDPDTGNPLLPDDPSNLDDGLGDIIINNRPKNRGYKSKAELKTILDRIDSNLYQKVKDFLCVATWSDPKVCNPVPLSLKASPAYDRELYQTRPGYPDSIITRYGRGRKNLPPGYPRNHDRLLFYDQAAHPGEAIVYGYQELNPCWIEITSRAPVNINTAPKEILVALLQGLQGFFVMPQLRDGWLQDATVRWSPVHRFYYPVSASLFDPNVIGEVGIVLRTTPVGLGLAREIASRIIEQRPFKTWDQFNRFVDSLVWHLGSGLIQDPRDTHRLNILDCAEGSDLPYRRLHWDHYRHLASQAMADVIKANFNPNLHLNEINPDANLHQLVDKTDLIRNSTEFCFLPTGYFQIESVGQILRAEWEDGKFHISPYLLIMKDSFDHNNQIMGQRKLKVVVKLWDLYRHTTQHDFMGGIYSGSNAPWPTNGNWACESGPEPVNGPAPFENRFEGYVTLATLGGSLPGDQKRIKGKLYRTDDIATIDDPCNSKNDPLTTYTTMHAHYDFDFRLHSCKAGKDAARPLAEYGVKDWTEDVGWRNYTSPYCAVYDPQRYKIARAYRYRDEVNPERISPVDHRRDGWYAERFAQLPYYPGGRNFPQLLKVVKTSVHRYFTGRISYWIKPGFDPGFNGYTRIVFSIGKEQESYYQGRFFGHMIGWLAHALGRGVFRETDTPFFIPGTPPHSMTFMFLSDQMIVWYIGHTLNHVHHDSQGPGWPPCRGSDSLLAHRWCHVTFRWYFRSKGSQGHIEATFYVNGQQMGNKMVFPYSMPYIEALFLKDYTGGGKYPFFLGGSWQTLRPAHCTIDELYVATNLEAITETCCVCHGEGKRPCPPCNIQYKCKGGRCRSYCRCGGDGIGPCVCPETRACKGGEGGDCGCRWFYKCKGGFYSICRLGCPCGGTGETDQCQTTCECEGSGEEPCKCDEIARCKGGEGGQKNCRPICQFYWKCEGTGYIDRNCWKCKGKGEIIKDVREIVIPGLPYMGEAMDLWYRGRYYRKNDATFTSGEIGLAGVVDRASPEPNQMSDPYGQPRWRGDEGVRPEELEEWLGQTWYHPKVKILGISWTGYTGGIIDHSQPDKPQLPVQLEVSLEAKDSDHRWVQIAGPFLNADSGWAPVMAKLSSGKIRYRVRFNTRCNPENAILLETPVLDDLTIYWATRPQFVSWEEGY